MGDIRLALEDKQAAIGQSRKGRHAIDVRRSEVVAPPAVHAIGILGAGLEVGIKGLQAKEVVAARILRASRDAVCLERTLGDGPKAIAQAVVGQGFKTVIADNGCRAKVVGHLHPATCGKAQQVVFEDILMRFPTNEERLPRGEEGNALRIAHAQPIAVLLRIRVAVEALHVNVIYLPRGGILFYTKDEKAIARLFVTH